MCRTGKINGVNYQDSLFRGIEVDGDSVDSDKIQFERALVNSQISNILKQAGVDTSSITKECVFASATSLEYFSVNAALNALPVLIYSLVFALICVPAFSMSS